VTNWVLDYLQSLVIRLCL